MNNKFLKIISDYLDKKDFILKETKKDFYFIGEDGDNHSQIRVIKKTNHCYIYNDLSNDIHTFFPFDYLNITSIISEYVGDKLNLKITKVSNTDKTWRVLIREN
jgi:hypothetical protein